MSRSHCLAEWQSDETTNGGIFFFAEGEPPKTTAQEARIAYSHKSGRPIVYKDTKVKNAREQLRWMVRPHRPKVPYDCPLAVSVTWIFPHNKSDKKGMYYWHDTKPDCGNLDKALLDVMEEEGFWVNDSRIVREIITKLRGDVPGIKISIEPITRSPMED